MKTAYISHGQCLSHDTGEDHPETARRIGAIEDRLIATGLFDLLRHCEAPEISREQLLRIHSPGYLESLESLAPQHGYMRLDPDTVMGPGTLDAAYRAAGAAVLAVDLLMTGQADNAFCCVRPPGHHAERSQAMGFCLFNNIAAGAAHALEAHGVGRVAILDFDVHHGNGTEDIFLDDDRVLFCSTFEHPFYPFTPLLENNEHRISVPLDASAKSGEFRAAVTDLWLPALERFQPEVVFVSAGFDAHRDDDMSHVSLEDADFRWVSEQIFEVAGRSASGRIVSTLEGGYDYQSLARCVELHLRVLMGLL
ncbi:MAG: histone deacetylase family protein [Xanthomonadales bacterium]|nr:histone deacetylase family protein [Xanthomonadales bacterium]